MADRRTKSGFLGKFLWGLVAAAVAAGLWLSLAPPSPETWQNISGMLDWQTDTQPQPPRTNPVPAAPAVEAAAWPTFDVVRVSRGGTGVIAGRAAPFANVEVLANGKTLGRVTADMRGEWVLIFDNPLAAGGSEISLVSTLPGQDPVASKDIVVVVVPERDQTFADSTDEGVLAIMSPRDGSGRSVLLQRPAGGIDFGGGLALDTVDYDDQGAAIFSGRAAPKSELRIYVDNAFKGVSRSNEGGRWSFAMAEPLPQGEHTARLDQVVGEGKVQLRVEVPFSRDMPLDVSRAAGSIVVQPGNNLWQISRKLYGTGFHYTVIFRLNRDNIKDPDLIYPDQVFALPKEAPGTATPSP